MSGEPLTLPRSGALFGKLPAHGDFVRRGDAGLVRRLDDWLTGEVERLARGKGDALDTILAALPVWGFVLPDGLAGAVRASHDRVGRVFPLVCCARGGRSVAHEVAALLTRAVNERLDADGVADALSGVDNDDPEAVDEAPRWWRASGEASCELAIAGLATGTDFDRLFDGPEPQDAS